VAVLDCEDSIAPVLEAHTPAEAPTEATRQSGAAERKK
jgi:hypothetical protein